MQNKIHKQNILSDTWTGILGSIAGPCDFLPARSDGPANFKKSAVYIKYSDWTILEYKYETHAQRFDDREAWLDEFKIEEISEATYR